MSDSGRSLGDCPHGRTPDWCVECLRTERDQLKMDLQGHGKAMALLNAGLESTCEQLDALKQRARKAEGERDQLTLALRDAHRQLTAYWKMTGSCPCGARRESPRTHPHVGGCPVAVALEDGVPAATDIREARIDAFTEAAQLAKNWEPHKSDGLDYPPGDIAAGIAAALKARAAELRAQPG